MRLSKFCLVVSLANSANPRRLGARSRWSHGDPGTKAAGGLGPRRKNENFFPVVSLANSPTFLSIFVHISFNVGVIDLKSNEFEREFYTKWVDFSGPIF
jgi:hypothetical protein